MSVQGVMGIHFNLPITQRVLTFIQETSCKLFVNTYGGSAEERAENQFINHINPLSHNAFRFFLLVQHQTILLVNGEALQLNGIT